MLRRASVSLLAVLLLFAIALPAQQEGALPVHGTSAGFAEASVAGTVLSQDGRPIKDVRVELHDATSGRLVGSAYTLPNGSFEIPNVSHGRYEIVATLGVNEVRDQVDVFSMTSSVSLRIGAADAASGDRSTVSVAQLKVPDKARKLYNKAQELADKNKLDDARKHVDQALAVFPKYAQALTLRGIISMQEKNPQQAVTDLEAAVQADSSYGMGYIALGAAYNMLSRFDDAIRTLSHAEAVAPAAWQLHYELSKSLLAKGDYDKALQQASKAGEISTDDYPPVHLVMAHAYLGLKDYQNAVAQLEQYLTRDPNGMESAKARQTLDQVKAFTASK